MATLRVVGMTCEHCEKAVTAELLAVPGVERLAITLNPGGVSEVEVTSSLPVSDDALAQAIEEAGYELAK